MKKLKAKRVKARRRWVINPKTRIDPGDNIYDRQREKKIYERKGTET